MSFQFDEQMAMADDPAVKEAISAYIRQYFPGVASIERASPAEDKLGTDYWVVLESGKKLSFDIKVRKTDYAYRDPPQDDLALERWSVVGKKIGWTQDQNKQTDFILWYWKDSGRFCILSFLKLCSVFKERMTEWIIEYMDEIHTQTTFTDHGIYQSECVLVPREIVMQAIHAKFAGEPTIKPVQVEQAESVPEPCP